MRDADDTRDLGELFVEVQVIDERLARIAAAGESAVLAELDPDERFEIETGLALSRGRLIEDRISVFAAIRAAERALGFAPPPRGFLPKPATS